MIYIYNSWAPQKTVELKYGLDVISKTYAQVASGIM